jgi:hypothetical protein
MIHNYTRLNGSSGLEARLQAMAEDMKKCRVLQSSTIQVEQTSVGQMLTVRKKSGAAASISVQRVTVTTDGNDSVTCTTADSVSITVAKPLHLRRSFYHGVTIGNWSYSATSSSTRRATYVGASVTGGLQNGDYIDEELDPQYLTTDTVLIVAEPEDGTGITDVTWIDLNVSARHFRPSRARLDVCRIENGVRTSRRVVVDGGPVF